MKIWGWSGQKITSFMRSAEERIKKDKDLAPGEYIHDYSQGTSAATLKRKREQATTETCGVIVTKSGMPKNVWKEIMVNITDSQEKIVLDEWNSRPDSPPSLLELIKLAFPSQNLDGRTKEGRAVKAFLATRRSYHQRCRPVN